MPIYTRAIRRSAISTYATLSAYYWRHAFAIARRAAAAAACLPIAAGMMLLMAMPLLRCSAAILPPPAPLRAISCRRRPPPPRFRLPLPALHCCPITPFQMLDAAEIYAYVFADIVVITLVDMPSRCVFSHVRHAVCHYVIVAITSIATPLPTLTPLTSRLPRRYAARIRRRCCRQPKSAGEDTPPFAASESAPPGISADAPRCWYYIRSLLVLRSRRSCVTPPPTPAAVLFRHSSRRVCFFCLPQRCVFLPCLLRLFAIAERARLPPRRFARRLQPAAYRCRYADATLFDAIN